MALLEMHDLKTFFTTKRGVVKAVNGVSYKVEAGRTLGVVGESGSGKSVSAMSMLQLLDGNGYIAGGSIMFDGKDLTKMPLSEMQKIRGNAISVIFQEPMTSLNPVFTIERQVSEPFIIHQGLSKEEARKKVVEMLADVKIPNPEVVAKQYPHQLSGGMRQRVMIAMALACKPKLLIADEPTTALDVTIQAQILKLMNDLKREHGTSILFITHDLGVIAQMADDVAVMYCGQVGNLPREMMNRLLDKGAVICAVFAGTDTDGYRYVIGSRSEDVRPISKALNVAFEGRGGGKPEMVQGSVKGTGKAMKELLMQYK